MGCPDTISSYLDTKTGCLDTTISCTFPVYAAQTLYSCPTAGTVPLMCRHCLCCTRTRLAGLEPRLRRHGHESIRPEDGNGFNPGGYQKTIQLMHTSRHHTSCKLQVLQCCKLRDAILFSLVAHKGLADSRLAKLCGHYCGALLPTTVKTGKE